MVISQRLRLLYYLVEFNSHLHRDSWEVYWQDLLRSEASSLISSLKRPISNKRRKIISAKEDRRKHVNLVHALARVLEKHPKKVLYAASALLPMTIMLIVWAFIGMYPFGSKSLMAVDFGQAIYQFLWLAKNAILTGIYLVWLFFHQISWWRYDRCLATI